MIAMTKRIIVSSVASAVVAGALALAPPGASSPINPIRGSDYTSAMNAPFVTVTPAWKVRANFLPEERFGPTIQLNTGLNVRVVSRSIRVGRWNGRVCVEPLSAASRSWSFVGRSGPDFEANRNIGAGAEVDLELYRGTREDPGAYGIGDTICVVQVITWSPTGEGGDLQVQYGTMSPPGVAPGPLVRGPQGGQEYPNTISAPAVSAIDPRGKFEVSFAPLSGLRRELTGAGYRAQLRDMVIRVGRFANGTCEIVGRRTAVGGSYSLDARLTAFESSTSWTSEGSRSGIITLFPNRTSQFQAGDTACVYQVVSWTAPEIVGTNRPVRYASSIGVTPNAAPEPLAIDPDLGPEDVDPGVFDGVEIVLPDFESTDADEQDALIDYQGVSATEVQQAAAIFREQLRTLASLFGANQANNPPAQQQAVQSIAANPRSVASAIETATRELGTLRTVAEQPNADPALVQQVDRWEQQVADIAAAVPIRVEGGVTQAKEIAAAVGFDSARSPVAGTAGTAKIGGLGLTVSAPKSVKAGKSVTVRVKASPANTKSVVRLALIRKVGEALRVVGTKQVTLRGGKATTRLTIPRKTSTGTYSLTASLVPGGRSGTGITVQRPIRVN